MNKKVFWFGSVAYFLVLLTFFYHFWLSKGNREPKVYAAEQLPPVATVEYVNPTESFPTGTLEKYQYRYGTLVIDRRYRTFSRLTPGYLFADIKVAWPGFEMNDGHLSSDENYRLRIMFEIQRKPASEFLDIYQNVVEDLSAFNGRDYSYNGFVGYRRRNGWVYITTDPTLITPQGTPLAISCSDPRFNLMYSDGSVGRCGFSHIYDEDLKSRVEFNETLMKNFPQVYRDLNVFLQSVKESN